MKYKVVNNTGVAVRVGGAIFQAGESEFDPSLFRFVNRMKRKGLQIVPVTLKPATSNKPSEKVTSDKAPEVKPQSQAVMDAAEKVEVKPETKAEVKPETKAEEKSETKPEPKKAEEKKAEDKKPEAKPAATKPAKPADKK